MRFLITDTPNELTIKLFIENLLRNDVKLLVGICGVNYKTAAFDAAEIEVKSLEFLEGTLPDGHVKQQWFRILVEHQNQHRGSCVAVHCNSGLGRAALLVAMALIELGMSHDIAVAVIRNKRRGAINDAQFAYLKEYQPQSKMPRRRSGSCLVQ
ncbi:PRL-1 phosphatase-like [Anastrepha obliqua]|uniref:PRL-1 phosphatase-like n=1 Tax=Anastrepha obliqua TaxID=95512 RepID=UPI00240A6C91|nr:PRL-1 phosphatase-like [Anastrepha obliqua]